MSCCCFSQITLGVRAWILCSVHWQQGKFQSGENCVIQKMVYNIQNRALRIMLNLGERESVIPVFTEMRILKFPDINVYLTSRCMFRYHCELVLGIFQGYFIYNTVVHKYYTRQCAYFHIPVAKSELSKFSIRYRGAVIWNEILKLGIDTSTSEVVFMESVKSRINDLKLCVS